METRWWQWVSLEWATRMKTFPLGQFKRRVRMLWWRLRGVISSPYELHVQAGIQTSLFLFKSRKHELFLSCRRIKPNNQRLGLDRFPPSYLWRGRCWCALRWPRQLHRPSLRSPDPPWSRSGPERWSYWPPASEACPPAAAGLSPRPQTLCGPRYGQRRSFLWGVAHHPHPLTTNCEDLIGHISDSKRGGQSTVCFDVGTEDRKLDILQEWFHQSVHAVVKLVISKNLENKHKKSVISVEGRPSRQLQEHENIRQAQAAAEWCFQEALEGCSSCV